MIGRAPARALVGELAPYPFRRQPVAELGLARGESPLLARDDLFHRIEAGPAGASIRGWTTGSAPLGV